LVVGRWSVRDMGVLPMTAAAATTGSPGDGGAAGSRAPGVLGSAGVRGVERGDLRRGGGDQAVLGG